MHYFDLINVLAKRRDVLRITQEQLADLSGVGLRTIKAIETGRGNPTVATLAKLADVLGLELRLEVKKSVL